MDWYYQLRVRILYIRGGSSQISQIEIDNSSSKAEHLEVKNFKGTESVSVL